MKPSEIMDGVFRIDAEIKSVEERLAPLKDRLELLGFVRSDVRSLLDAGAPWLSIEERLQDLAAGITPDAPSDEQLAEFAKRASKEQEEAPYGRKADGTPKKAPGRKTKAASAGFDLVPPDGEPPPKSPEGPPLVAVGGHPCLDRQPDQIEAHIAAKPHVAPLSSPLTPNFRATLELALGASPTTVYALSKLSTLHGLDVEGLLAEAPDTFINWTDPGPQKYSLWGLPHQFDAAVRSVSVPDMLAASGGGLTYVAKALGCSVSAVLAAWARLDPEAA